MSELGEGGAVLRSMCHFFLFVGKYGGGLFGKKPVPIEELEASYVAASSAVKDKSDL
jgi:hypothetical protein